MLLTVIIQWCERNGLDEPSARAYITEFTGALSRKAATWDGDLEDLAREMTPGGLNWMALTHLEEKDAYTPWTGDSGADFGEGYKRIESRWKNSGRTFLTPRVFLLIKV